MEYYFFLNNTNADYMYETTTPAKNEKLSDEKVNGALGFLLLDLAIQVFTSSVQSSFVD